MRYSRRSFLAASLAGGVTLVLPRSATAQDAYRAAALQAAAWLRAKAMRTDAGAIWPADPADTASAGNSLYSSTPGVVLFFLEAHRLTGERDYLTQAHAGAETLIAALEAEKETGLYTGIAGMGFVLAEMFKATRDDDYREAAHRAARLLGERAKTAGTNSGIEWNDTTDIISGSAGTGLFLLYAARELEEPSARATAVRAGRRLIELAKKENEGLKWAMNPTFARLMPNFSHGTAGVAYFLATIHHETRRPEFLEAALGGARYLLSIARAQGDGTVVFHNEPDGKDLYYLGWCHGPAGTARLFYRLYQITGDREWMFWTERFARGVMTSGIPKNLTPGFWNNVGQCCGSAGVGEFMLGMYRVTRNPEFLAFARMLTDDLLRRATRERGGLKWIHAEHRVRPELLVAQTGYMQGAAGIGMWLLHLDAHTRNSKKPMITFPDSPW